MNQINTITLWGGAKAVTASATATSDTITLNGPVGYMSLQIVETGDGTGKWEVEYSNDKTNWRTPAGVSDIVTAHTKATGSSGNEIYQITNGIFRYMRIKVTETSTTDDLSATATLAIQ